MEKLSVTPEMAIGILTGLLEQLESKPGIAKECIDTLILSRRALREPVQEVLRECQRRIAGIPPYHFNYLEVERCINKVLEERGERFSEHR